MVDTTRIVFAFGRPVVCLFFFFLRNFKSSRFIFVSKLQNNCPIYLVRQYKSRGRIRGRHEDRDARKEASQFTSTGSNEHAHLRSAHAPRCLQHEHSTIMKGETPQFVLVLFPRGIGQSTCVHSSIPYRGTERGSSTANEIADERRKQVCTGGSSKEFRMGRRT